MEFGLILDEQFTHHRTPPGHPERPERLRAVGAALQDLQNRPEVKRLKPIPAEPDWIRLVHSDSLFRQVQDTRGASLRQLDVDTMTSPDSFDVAMLAAGSSVTLVRAILAGEVSRGLAAVRPPGHHAESARAMGFCLFNNVAVAAGWALRQGGAQKVAIIDFDVHHGNGTQEIFYARPDVLYLSQHQHPWYPGTGLFEETGVADGKGFTVNFPIAAGAGNSFYLRLFKDFVVPIVSEFRPDVLLISAGFDAHRDDPLGRMELTEGGYGSLANLLNRLADDVCGGRIAYFLEGGYDLSALAASLSTVIDTSLAPQKFELEEDGGTIYQRYRETARGHFRGFWKL